MVSIDQADDRSQLIDEILSFFNERVVVLGNPAALAEFYEESLLFGLEGFKRSGAGIVVDVRRISEGFRDANELAGEHGSGKGGWVVS